MIHNITTHYYVRKEDLQKDFLNNLLQRKIDEKFLYIGERQANSWIAICNSPEYTYYRDSKKLLATHIQDLVADHKGEVNLIVLGPGDALKEKIVLDSLQEKGRVNLFFIDSSEEILNIAVKNTRDSNAIKELFLADLTNGMDLKNISRYIKNKYSPVNFFTFLGNTLGNYPQAKMLSILRNALEPGDKILLDVHTKPTTTLEEEAVQIDKTVQIYNSTQELERILAILEEAHINPTDGTLEVKYCSDELFPQMEVVKQYFCFNEPKIITYQGEAIPFSKGDYLLVGYSNKYILTSLNKKNVFTSHGLRILKHAQDATGKHYQALCELA